MTRTGDASGSTWTRAGSELAASALVVLAAFLSGAVRVQLGAAALAGAIAAASALGFAYGLVIWTFGPRGAQITPWATALRTLLGGGTSRGALVHVGAQTAGAGAATVAVWIAFPATAAAVTPAASSSAVLLREAVGAFVLVLVTLGVAHRRDARVPFALAASSCASVLMTGSASAGNPLVVLAIACAAGLAGQPGWLGSRQGVALLGQFLGAAVGATLATWIFPWSRSSASALLFQPGPARRG